MPRRRDSGVTSNLISRQLLQNRRQRALGIQPLSPSSGLSAIIGEGVNRSLESETARMEKVREMRAIAQEEKQQMAIESQAKRVGRSRDRAILQQERADTISGATDVARTLAQKPVKKYLMKEGKELSTSLVNWMKSNKGLVKTNFDLGGREFDAAVEAISKDPEAAQQIAQELGQNLDEKTGSAFVRDLSTETGLTVGGAGTALASEVGTGLTSLSRGLAGEELGKVGTSQLSSAIGGEIAKGVGESQLSEGISKGTAGGDSLVGTAGKLGGSLVGGYGAGKVAGQAVHTENKWKQAGAAGTTGLLYGLATGGWKGAIAGGIGGLGATEKGRDLLGRGIAQNPLLPFAEFKGSDVVTKVLDKWFG